MAADGSLPPDYFESMFADSDDPWNLASSPYEAAKFEATVAALQGRRYLRGFEVGCATGVLTARLAPLCGALLAVDVSPSALARARERCKDLPQVRFDQMTFPETAPAEDAAFDLIVLSEVAYYWDDRDLTRAGRCLARGMAAGGDLVLVHWTGETDYPQSADTAVAGLAATLEDSVEIVTTQRARDYRLDLWRRR